MTLSPDPTGAIDAAAVIVIRDGVEILRRGDVTRPMFVHSVRKSLLGLLLGIAIEAGQLTLETTVGELGIDDHPPLTDTEKSATIGDLLTCRSGVFLPTPPHPLAPPRPARGSAPPGQVWNYNNWDFNALGSAYERATGKSLYLAFDRLVARQLGFEDWDAFEHSGYRYEPDPLGAGRTFPTYTFRLSARDLARFAQLYLHRGCWEARQIVSADWIARSTERHTETSFGLPLMRHYGYLWWLAGDEDAGIPADAATAWGISGTFITVIPSRETVVVVLTDPDGSPTAHTVDAGQARIHIPPPVYASFLAELLAGPATRD